jgi:rare lipoprotein A
MLMTAAHRSLPFGTIVDVKNPATGQTVRVRINDRGPYVGNRLIDLAYAAAQQISLIEPGSGEVDLTIVQVGRGDREPPAPYVVSVPDLAAGPSSALQPSPAPATPPAEVAPVTVDRVQVVEEHASQPGVETRRQVAADGRTIESVPRAPVPAPVAAAAVTPAPVQPAPQPVVASRPVTPALALAPVPAPRAPAAPASRPPAAVSAAGKFVVQVGAFAQEPNAKALQDRLTKIGQQSYVDRSATLYRVRIGPFATREQAIAARAKLEAAGISAIVVAP